MVESIVELNGLVELPVVELSDADCIDDMQFVINIHDSEGVASVTCSTGMVTSSLYHQTS